VPDASGACAESSPAAVDAAGIGRKAPNPPYTRIAATAHLLRHLARSMRVRAMAGIICGGRALRERATAAAAVDTAHRPAVAVHLVYSTAADKRQRLRCVAYQFL
jgi:hypothetical protein